MPIVITTTIDSHKFGTSRTSPIVRCVMRSETARTTALGS